MKKAEEFDEKGEKIIRVHEIVDGVLTENGVEIGYRFIRNLDGTEIQCTILELTRLTKDILWFYTENGPDLHNASMPADFAPVAYWQYPLLEGDRFEDEIELNFYKEGALIIVYCMISEFLALERGNQKIFGQTAIKEIIAYIDKFQPTNDNQKILQGSVLGGLYIIEFITEDDIKAGYSRNMASAIRDFYSKSGWITKTFVEPYFERMMSESKERF